MRNKASFQAFSTVKQGTISEVVKATKKYLWLQPLISHNLSLVVGVGDTILFWMDSWTGYTLLKEQFPRLFSISLQQHQLISEVGFWNANLWDWNLTWRRNLFQWENEQLEALVSFYR